MAVSYWPLYFVRNLKTIELRGYDYDRNHGYNTI